ncbi:MAG: alpha/beta fold hydrolase [Planctomycetota bacterium]|nr:MAG: alpha/beta fold hydrolase [Planctomycetota bacterium]
MRTRTRRCWLYGATLLSGLAAATVWLPRRMLYPAPAPRPVLPPPGASLLELPREDGGRVVALWLAPAEPHAPVLLWFHGNGEQLADQRWWVEQLGRRGLGVLAVEYPGYGPAAHERPSEERIYETAEAALRALGERLEVEAQRTVLGGRSLGTGVAVELASRHPAAAVVLISPYTSIPDVARHVFRLPLPYRWLVPDHFDSARKAAALSVPVLVFYGERDELIPPAMSRRLAAQLPNARVSAIPNAGHGDILAVGGAELIDELARFANDSVATAAGRTP